MLVAGEQPRVIRVRHGLVGALDSEEGQNRKIGGETVAVAQPGFYGYEKERPVTRMPMSAGAFFGVFTDLFSDSNAVLFSIFTFIK